MGQTPIQMTRMTSGAKMMISRGVKSTPNQDPRFIIGKATIVIVAEYKQPNAALKARGLRLMTSTIRCSTPDVFDLRLNSHSRLNFIQALIQAINMGADEALMLDGRGFVASCNSTNFFIIRGEELWTSTGATCVSCVGPISRSWRRRRRRDTHTGPAAASAAATSA